MGVVRTKEFVATVRAAGDIARLVGDYVALKPAGSRLKGLCPFHQEKTPSFSVDPERGLFYCFGCQAGGDVFKFVMLYEQLEFPAAVEFLAKRWGVPLPTADAPGDRIRRRIEEANRAADAWFRARLADPEGGRAARDYLSRRGIRPETAEALGLGFAPDAWDALLGHLGQKGFRPEEIERAGLALRRKSGDGHYDRFRSRLVFPIRDLQGIAVAFGGRALGDGEPKYLNSPETPAYVKGEHLFGLDRARDAIRREGLAILVEGYLDLAAVRQAGFDHVVASLGTAFTSAQAKLLGRFARRVVVAYDGDDAGVAAAGRAADALLEEGIEVRIARLPEGSDPDDLVRSEGAEAFGARVLEAPGWFEFLIAREKGARDLSRPEEKVAAINALLPRLARLSAIERAEWAGRMAEAFGVEDGLLTQELREAVRAGRGAVRHRAAPRPRPRLLDLQLVSMLLEDAGMRNRFREEIGIEGIRGSAGERVVETILRLDVENGIVDYPGVAEALEGEEDRDLLHLAAFREGEPFESGEAGYLACLETIRRETLRREGREVERRLREPETAGEADGDALLARRMQIARQIDAMS